MKTFRFLSGLSAVLAAISSASAGVYQQDFEIDSTASWTVNTGPSDFAADFFFDYAAIGIPAAPGGTGTRGMKLQANLTNATFSGMSVSPTGESFTGDYTVSFDWWASFNGPFPVGGSGSTNLSTFGIGTAGTTPQWPGGVQDSVWFGGTGDGNSSFDWRAYSTAAPTGYPDGDPVFPYPSRNASDPYFDEFGNNTAPQAHLDLFPQQTGVTMMGSAGIEWHLVTIEKTGTTVIWRVDGLLMATIDLTTVTLGGNNIFFGHSDINTTSSNDPEDVNLLFTLIDNISVSGEPICTGDVDGDGDVDLSDLAILLANYGMQSGATLADGDLDGDEDVDLSDLALLLANFGTICQ
jgi:hypothetical protein